VVEMERQLTVRIPEKLALKLEAEAAKSARSISGLVRYALLTFAEQLPDAPESTRRVGKRAAKTAP
jgi:hypothetical protein